MADGKRPLASGFFFSIGHSAIAVAVGGGITIAARGVWRRGQSQFDLRDGWRCGRDAGVGRVLSPIALLNLIVLSGIFKVSATRGAAVQLGPGLIPI
jgi:nickel/cobalt transporter (NiCoT) family protein